METHIDNINITQQTDIFNEMEILEKLVNNKVPAIRAAIASHPDLFQKTPHIAEKLVNDKSEVVRSAIAKHPDLFTLAPHLAEKLVDDVHWMVRQSLIENINLFAQPNIVEKILNKSVSVRILIAKRPDLFSVTLEIAEKLSSDADWFVRAKIAEHPNLLDKAPHIAEKLANDEDEFVRFLITKRDK